jgi:hypothetical protein
MEGRTGIDTVTGRRVVVRNGVTVYADEPIKSGKSGGDGTDTKGVQASAEQRGRINLTFDPALEAHRKLVASEQYVGNSFNNNPIARTLSGVPVVGGVAARVTGGQQYQDYQSASKAFESAILPILSGASVTESEGRRMIEAALPQLGDSPQTLRDKARRREQMLNGAVAALGGEPVFPASRAYRGPPRPGATGPLAGISPLRPKGGPVYNPRTQAQSQSRNIARPRNEAEFNRLPVGSQYVNPADGKVYTKVR